MRPRYTTVVSLIFAESWELDDGVKPTPTTSGHYGTAGIWRNNHEIMVNDTFHK